MIMELDLDDILKNMNELKTKYKLKAIMYNKSLLSTGLQAVQPKDIMTSGGRRTQDKLLLALIKQSELSDKLEDIVTAYNAYRELAINKLLEYSKIKTIDEMIIIYRDKMRFKWNAIAFIVDLSRTQTIKNYKKMKSVL